MGKRCCCSAGCHEFVPGVGKFGGNDVKVDGEDFLLLRADDIYAVIED